MSVAVISWHCPPCHMTAKETSKEDFPFLESAMKWENTAISKVSFLLRSIIFRILLDIHSVKDFDNLNK